MQVKELTSDILLFVGQDHESVATAFLDGNDVLLIDSLGSQEDAERLRDHLCDGLGKTVRVIGLTHFMSDHIAGLSVFPEAMSIAHRSYRHAYLSQNRRMDHLYREPKLVFDGNLSLRWGAHELRFTHNPGKTMDHVSVDVPAADLVCAGDNIVGNIVYLSKADPVMLGSAIDRMRQFGRRTVVGGHMGEFPGVVLDNAMHYLARLRGAVTAIRLSAGESEVSDLIGALRIEDCLAAKVEPSAFERKWHQHNLEAIVAQSIFALDAAARPHELFA